jgi:DNA-binding NtrC family response regulator
MEKISVLFVDDETDFLETLLKRMTKRGIDAGGAASGREALERLAAASFDVVVLDVRMPEMDGLQTLREIKALRPLTEVILLTGHACIESAREGMEQGAFDYLIKPVSLDELLYKIQDAHKRKAIQEEKIRQMEEVIDTCEPRERPDEAT